METLLLARAKYLLDRVSNNVKYPTLDGSPALPAEAAALIECLGKLGLVEDADAMRKDFIVYFAHEVRLPNTGLDPRLVEFVSTANERFGPFLKYGGPEGDCTVVRLRLIDHFEGLRITFKKLSMLSLPLTPPASGTGADEGKAGSQAEAAKPDGETPQGEEIGDDALPANDAQLKALTNDVKRLKANERKLKSKTEIIRQQRNKFSKPRRSKKTPETWAEIYRAYRAKYPTDEKASPSTLRLSYERNEGDSEPTVPTV